MRRQRFPFLINAFPRRPWAATPSPHASLQELSKKTSRALASLSIIESSLEELVERAVSDPRWREFCQELIPILDGFDALRAAIERQGDPSWRRGMEILSQKLAAALESRGLQRTAQVGMSFDPSRHESVGVQESSEVSPGAVVEVVQSGWCYRSEILRYAKVVVARGGS